MCHGLVQLRMTIRKLRSSLRFNPIAIDGEASWLVAQYHQYATAQCQS